MSKRYPCDEFLDWSLIELVNLINDLKCEIDVQNEELIDLKYKIEILESDNNDTN